MKSKWVEIITATVIGAACTFSIMRIVPNPKSEQHGKKNQTVALDRETKEEKEAVALTPSKRVLLTVQEKRDAQAILKNLHYSSNELTGPTWLESSSGEGYDNQIHLSIGLTDSNEPLLHLTVAYQGAKRLLLRKAVFRIDDTTEIIEPAKRIERNWGSYGWRERFDQSALPYLGVLGKIADGKTVIMRFQGDEDTQEKTVSPTEKTSLGQMLLVYRYLKEQTETVNRKAGPQ